MANNQGGYVDGLGRPMPEPRRNPEPLDLPRIAVEALSQAYEDQLAAPRLPQGGHAVWSPAELSTAASLLMIAELLEKQISEFRQLRGILTTRKPAL